MRKSSLLVRASLGALFPFMPAIVDISSAFSPATSQHYTRTSRTSATRRDFTKPLPSTSAVLSATSIDLSGDESTKILKNNVKRKYETFRWFHGETNVEYDINYGVEGSGPPILLIHGFGANVNHFRFQFPALVEQGYRVHAVDLLGFGASDKPGEPEYSIELFVQLLKDFVEHKHIDDSDEKWFIAGNSIGGLCSLGVAEQLPDIVGGVVLFNCTGGMTGF